MRYFIWFSYDGERYHGWQVQPNGITVQSELERCLSLLLRESITATGAGRTDAGVHARQMAAHFDTDAQFDTVVLAKKLNGFFHHDIAVDRIVPIVIIYTHIRIPLPIAILRRCTIILIST